MADLAQHCQNKGYRKIHLFLDRNTTHKNKMWDLFEQLKTDRNLHIQMNFHLMAAYSPKLNLVEYAIHLIRQKIFHHADCKKDLDVFISEVKHLCEVEEKLLTKVQVVNILEHIKGLVYENVV